MVACLSNLYYGHWSFKYYIVLMALKQINHERNIANNYAVKILMYKKYKKDKGGLNTQENHFIYKRTTRCKYKL